MRLRTLAVAALAGVLMVSGTGAAFAAQEAETESAAPALDTVKERVLKRIESRIEGFERTIERLGDKEGVAPEQWVALAGDGIAVFEAASAEVEAAETVREVFSAVKDANREYDAHRRVRRLYVHVSKDVAKFTRALDRLDGAIERAEEAGVDVTDAVAESTAAATDLASAQAMLDAIDPSQTGSEVMDDLKEAHRTAHSGQKHVRTGWRALRTALDAG